PRPGKDDHSGLPEFQLFDVSTDPGETKNLSAEHPDRVASMKAMMEQLIARGRSTPGSDQANDVPIELLKPVANPAKKKAAAPKKK
ncbi:MAG: arylsulfatase, partial [Verrucomicrobiae bacterium]|nr:arylsulfatase [Verrucomicrobiae bacterium]